MPHVESNGIQMYYEERGSGDPLIMIMGITAPGGVWEDHADAWMGDFRCIYPDNRGVGQSEMMGRGFRRDVDLALFGAPDDVDRGC